MAKKKAKVKAEIREEAHKLKRKKAWSDQPWSALYGVATRIVTGKGPKKKEKKR